MHGCGIAFINIAAGWNYLGGAQLDNTMCSFTTEASFAAGDDNNSVSEGFGWLWWSIDELAADEGSDATHAGNAVQCSTAAR
jgi:hypothetical protein